jgi:hypothetical protein
MFLLASLLVIFAWGQTQAHTMLRRSVSLKLGHVVCKVFDSLSLMSICCSNITDCGGAAAGVHWRKMSITPDPPLVGQQVVRSARD